MLYGWDASHYDAVPSAPRVVAEGFSFFTHKAGGDADDAELAAWWKAMKPQRDRILLGAYWVLYPGNPVTRANKFIARLDSQCPGWRDGPFILQVDCEKWNGDSSTVPKKDDIKAFCDRLVQAMPKLRPIVYAPKWVYGESLKGLGYPLWASAYVSGSGTASGLYPGDDSGKWDAYSGQVPAILQFTSSAKIAGQTTSDANAFRGTIVQLQNLVAPGWAPPKPPRKVNTLKFQVTMPVLKEGDDDKKFDGYNMIARVQKIVGVTPDGNWGPKTTAAIASWCKVSNNTAKTMNENLWRELLGLSAAA